MRPLTLVEQAHFDNRLRWLELTGVDCYLNAFCDVSDTDPLAVSTMSSSLLAYMSVSMWSTDGKIHQHLAYAGNQYSRTLVGMPVNTPSEQLIINRHLLSVIHIKLCTLFWKEYGYNFYHPTLLPISLEDVDLPTVQARARELNASIGKWKNDGLDKLLARIERNLHSLNKNDT